MQSASSRIWTRVTDSISEDDNGYASEFNDRLMLHNLTSRLELSKFVQL